MITPMSKVEEQRIANGIEAAVRLSVKNPDMTPTDALEKVAREYAFSPNIIHRTCTIFNRTKSIYMLEKMASENRADSFPLADSAEIVSRIYGVQPVAPADIKLEFNAPTMAKTASEQVHPEYSGGSEYLEHPDFFTKKLYKVASKLEHSFNSQRGALTDLNTAISSDFQTIIAECRNLPEGKLHKFARIIVNKFGDRGVDVLKIVSEGSGREVPLTKTASFAILPADDLYITAVRLFDNTEKYAEQLQTVTKTAHIVRDYFEELQAFEELSVLYKEAVTSADLQQRLNNLDQMKDQVNRPELVQPLITKATGALIGRAPGDIIRGVADVGADVMGKAGLLGDKLSASQSRILDMLGGGKDREMYLNVLSPAFLNKLDTVKHVQNWTDLASDPVLKNYKAEEVIDAYNKAIGLSPELAVPKMRTQLNAAVRNLLSTRGMVGMADVKQFADINKALVETDVKRQAIKDAQGKAGMLQAVHDREASGDKASGLREEVAGALTLRTPGLADTLSQDIARLGGTAQATGHAIDEAVNAADAGVRDLQKNVALNTIDANTRDTKQQLGEAKTREADEQKQTAENEKQQAYVDSRIAALSSPDQLVRINARLLQKLTADQLNNAFGAGFITSAGIKGNTPQEKFENLEGIKNIVKQDKAATGNRQAILDDLFA